MVAAGLGVEYLRRSSLAADAGQNFSSCLCSKGTAKATSDSTGTEGAPEYAAGLRPAALLWGRVNAVNDGETARVPRCYMA